MRRWGAPDGARWGRRLDTGSESSPDGEDVTMRRWGSPLDRRLDIGSVSLVDGAEEVTGEPQTTRRWSRAPGGRPGGRRLGTSSATADLAENGVTRRWAPKDEGYTHPGRRLDTGSELPSSGSTT